MSGGRKFRTPTSESSGSLNVPEISNPLIRMFDNTTIIICTGYDQSGKDVIDETTSGNFLHTMTAVEKNG